MRSDMSKVIVERPRLRFPLKVGSAYPRGHLENQWAPHLEDAPQRESMGGRYGHKYLNENLQPLVRYLRSNVGRPWNKVHSEIAAQISCSNTVQKHVLDHLYHYVELHPIYRDGVVGRIGYFRFEPLTSWGMHLEFYVCPRSGILKLAPFVKPKKRYEPKPDPDRRILSHERELRRIRGIWYEWLLADALPDSTRECVDAVTSRYILSKRQLNSREIARLGLPRES